MASPSQREAPSRSPSHNQAISAPQIGTVALNTDISAVLSASAETAYSRKGSAELTTPTPAIAAPCVRQAAPWPLSSISGTSSSAAPATRTKARATGPNSAAPRRMNRKLAPQMAASSKRSSVSRRVMCRLVRPRRHWRLAGPQRHPGPAG